MIWLIAQNELRRAFFSLRAWLVMAAVSFLAAAFFYTLLAAWMNDPVLHLKSGLNETVVADFFQISGIVLLLLAPVLTMRLFSEERRDGSLQLVLSSPVSLTQLVLGKFFGAWGLALALLVLAGLLPVSLLPVSLLDFGQLAAAWLGLVLMVSSFIAVGLFISSLCTSQTSAALGALAALFVLWIIGLSGQGDDLFAWLSLLNHYSHLRSGLLDTADLAYYLLLGLFAIGLTVWRLDAARLHGAGSRLLRANSAAILLLLLLLLGLAAWASHQYGRQYDWTRHGRHSLSAGSQEILAQLPEELLVTAYARDDPALRSRIRDFVMRYQRHKENLRLHFLNPDLAPHAVRSMRIQVEGELVLHYQDRLEHVRQLGEQHFSQALIRLGQAEEQWLVFVEGHGERSPFARAGQDFPEQDFSEWARRLGDRGFKVQALDLAGAHTIPDNVSVLILNNPNSPYQEQELALLRRYIAAGGNLLWLVDPGALHGLQALGQTLGLTFADGVIVDRELAHPLLAEFRPMHYGRHVITADLELTAVLPGVRAIVGAPEPHDGWQVGQLLRTGARTWNETGSLEPVPSYEFEQDQPGPLQAGISLQRAARDIPARRGGRAPEREQRIVVLGDGDFLSNRYLGRGGNLELGMRLINWLSFQEQLLRVPARLQPDRGVHLSRRRLQLGGSFFLLLLPALFVGAGLWIRFRRYRAA